MSDIECVKLSVLFVCYKQESQVEAALRSILAQDYPNLEIIVSDDASPDGTFAVLEKVVQGYQGPHRVILSRNVHNLGVGGNIARAVSLSSGELLFIAAGDDISVPHRCSRVAQAWDQTGRQVDLIASTLIDMDAAGQLHGVIRPSALHELRSPEDWVRHRPHVVGAAQAWTRRAYDHFGPLPQGVVAEDLVMVFRAICLGGALSIDEPLVQYRRGGLSGRVRAMDAQEVIRRLLSNNRHALVESELMLADARKAGCSPDVMACLEREWRLARWIDALFHKRAGWQRLQMLWQASEPAWGQRVRLWVYAACPAVMAPFFALKRAVSRRKAKRA